MKEKILAVLDAISEYCLYGLIFFIPVTKVAISVLAGMLLLVFVIKKAARPDFSFLGQRALWFLLLFAVFCSLSLINSGELISKSLHALLIKWFRYLGIFIFVQEAISKRKIVINLVGVFLFSAALLGLDGVSQRFFGLEFFRFRQLVEVRSGVFAISGPFNHYNDFGAYLVIALSLVTALMFFGKGRGQAAYRYFLSGLEALLLVCLFLTFSRGSWLGFACSLLFMALLTGRLRRFALLALLCAGLILFLPGIKERVAFTFQPYGDSDRFSIWATAFRMIRENPLLGKGIGTFMDYFSRYTPSAYAQYAHNCYLQIWAETGVFSLISFLAFLVLSFIRCIGLYRKGRNNVMLGLCCGLFGFLVHSFFDTHLYSLQLAVLFWSVFGIIYGIMRLETAGIR